MLRDSFSDNPAIGSVREAFVHAVSGKSAARRTELQAAQILEAHPHFRGRKESIGCRLRNRRLYLTGSVPTFYLKQLAQEALRDLAGVDRIENQIVVASPVGELGCQAAAKVLTKPQTKPR